MTDDLERLIATVPLTFEAKDIAAAIRAQYDLTPKPKPVDPLAVTAEDVVGILGLGYSRSPDMLDAYTRLVQRVNRRVIMALPESGTCFYNQRDLLRLFAGEGEP